MTDHNALSCVCQCHGMGAYATCSVDGGCGYLHTDSKAGGVEKRVQCVTCTKTPPRRATPGYVTCDRCADLIRECLAEILTLYATVAAPGALLPQVSDGARRAPGFGSRSPANDTTIVLTDKRTTWTEESRYHNPLVVLESWARMVREDVGMKPPATRATVTSEVGLLVKRLDFITRQSWVDDMWKELREVRGELRDFNGIPKPRRVGTCKVMVERNDEWVECGTPLWAPVEGDVIKCRGCKEEWDRRRWLLLGQTLTTKSDDGSAA